MAITNGFQVSPGINIKEKDISQFIAAVASTDGALAGVFSWGPIKKVVQITDEPTLVATYGRPSNLNGETWFVASDFLADSDSLYISRAGNTSAPSPYIAVNVTANSATVSATNTAPLAIGMIAITSDMGNILTSAIVTSIINSTAFTIGSAQQAIGTGSDNVQFIANNGVFSAIANNSAVTNLAVNMVFNNDDYTTKDGTFDPNLRYIAKYPGVLGNSLRVSRVDTATAFTSTINLAASLATISINVGSNTATITVANTTPGANLAAATASVNALAQSLVGNFQLNDYVRFGDNDGGFQSLKVTGFSNVAVSANATLATATFTMSYLDILKLISSQNISTSINRYWEFFDLVNSPPMQSDYVRLSGNSAANDELHLVVVDDGGMFTGTPGAVLEVYQNVSRATDSKLPDGSSNWYKTLINTKSPYIWFANDRNTAFSNTALNLTSGSNNQVQNIRFNSGANGSDEASVSLSALSSAYDRFASAEDIDISLVIAGKALGGTAGTQLANYLIDNIAEKRKDVVVFISPTKNAVVNNIGGETDACEAFRNALRSTSYGFFDCNYKYTYDRYNDIYRWVPTNGAIAGLAVRTDRTNDPWWSFAGFNRGQIKNVIKLAWNPKKAQRDRLYKIGINPVNTFPADGTVLYGDKTLQAKASAFDRVNVRRLFIVMEKAIASYAKYSLFEFNDEVTRSLFKSRIIPYLRDIKARRGLYDFLVICDETNNTGQVIDTNQFVGDIKVKPAKSINYITLNFVAVGSSVTFSETAGI